MAVTEAGKTAQLRFAEALRQFHTSAQNLDAAWDEVLKHSMFVGSVGYPFGVSFPELVSDIGRWSEAVTEKCKQEMRSGT